MTDVTWANWFGGKYGDGKDFFAQFAIDPESYLKMYPEFIIPEEQKQGQMIHFLKNLGLLGAMLFIIANGPGLFSADVLFARTDRR